MLCCHFVRRVANKFYSTDCEAVIKLKKTFICIINWLQPAYKGYTSRGFLGRIYKHGNRIPNSVHNCITCNWNNEVMCNQASITGNWPWERKTKNNAEES